MKMTFQPYEDMSIANKELAAVIAKRILELYNEK